MRALEEEDTCRPTAYCDSCGMPPEYCAYGPDFETHCVPWFKAHHPRLFARYHRGWERDLNKAVAPAAAAADGDGDGDGADGDGAPPAAAVTAPWTMHERLAAFYAAHAPEKLDGVDAVLEKYAGKEDKLFAALVKKYGPEPQDPFYADDGAVTAAMADLALACEGAGKGKKLRRGAAAKTVHKVDARVVVQKISRNRKKAVTHVVGLDTVPGVKLKEAAKAFSKRFAGSSSVKDKEIIIQGDHLEDVAEMIVKKFKAKADTVFLDLDGEFVCFG